MAQGFPGRLRPRIFLTFRHYKGGRSSAKRTGRRYTRRNPWYSLSEAESTSGHMFLSVPRKKSPVTPSGIDPVTVRLVAQHLNHYATPGHKSNILLLRKAATAFYIHTEDILNSLYCSTRVLLFNFSLISHHFSSFKLSLNIKFFFLIFFIVFPVWNIRFPFPAFLTRPSGPFPL